MKLKNKTILIFAAHQDDETIGCGASIKKWSDDGNSICVCFVTDGSTGKEQGKDFGDIIHTRMEEVNRVSKILGISKIMTLSLECQKVVNKRDTFHKVIKIIRDVKETYKYKEQAMQEYFSQHGILNDIHSYIDGLSKVRGYSVGAARGEAFTRIGRMPIRL
jgi:LmbE family N-acetylglucosaminyl deacetylase